jgi:hypothetical protein
MDLGVSQEPRMPKTNQNPGSQESLPLIICRYNGMHQREKLRRVILDLDIDIELYVQVFRLTNIKTEILVGMRGTYSHQ